MRRLLCAAFLLCACAAEGYDTLMKRAREFRLGGKPEKAEKIYDGIIEKNPNDSDALCGRGFCRLTGHARYDEAIADFDRVIEIAPDYVDAYVGKASALRRTGDRNRAHAVLEACRAACGDDAEKLRYLAMSAWKEAHFVLARALDREFPPKPGRKLIDRPNEIYLTVTRDWLDRGDDWNNQGVTYVRRQRPDLTLWASVFGYERNDENDTEIGLGVSYRHTRELSFEYALYLVGSPDVLADQKHRLKTNITILPNTVLGVGIDLSQYDSDWATIGRLKLTRYVNQWYGTYTLLAGSDNNNENVATHIFEIGYEKEPAYTARVGYATGNESVETGTAGVFSDDRIDSLYGSVRWYVRPEWGFIVGAATEARDNDHFRSTGSFSVFYRW